jgi:hypothetical protein
MGLQSLPYQAVQAMDMVEEAIQGDQKDPSNVFCWNQVHLNLPGSDKYDPSKPWVSKLHLDDG